VLGTAVTEKYFTADETTTTGDVFRLARNQVNRDALAILDGGRRDSSNIINTACYNFLGDPEIPLYIPAEKVRLTSVNGSTDGKSTSRSSPSPARPARKAPPTRHSTASSQSPSTTPPSRPRPPQPKTARHSHTPPHSTRM